MRYKREKGLKVAYSHVQCIHSHTPTQMFVKSSALPNSFKVFLGYILRHIGLLEADEDKIRKIRPKGTQVIMLYVPREPIRP